MTHEQPTALESLRGAALDLKIWGMTELRKAKSENKMTKEILTD